MVFPPPAGLESEAIQVFADLSAATVLCAVGDERIQYFNDFFLPANRQQNSQQDALASSYMDQVTRTMTNVISLGAKNNKQTTSTRKKKPGSAPCGIIKKCYRIQLN